MRAWLDGEEEAAGVFQAFFDADQEGDGFAAIDDAVVVGDREVHHRADFDFAGDCDGAVLDFVHPEDGGLGGV